MILQLNINIPDSKVNELARLVEQLSSLSVPVGKGVVKTPKPKRETASERKARIAAKLDKKLGFK